MARISQAELEASIAHQNKPSQEAKNKKAKPETILYTLFGVNTEVDENGNPITYDEHKAYAKQVCQGTSYSYYVKVGNSGHLHDPLGLYATREQSKVGLTRGKPELRFVKSNKQAFDYYVKYLATKNKAWLAHASRSL